MAVSGSSETVPPGTGTGDGQLHRTIVGSVPLPVVVADLAAATIVDVNAEACAYLGHPADDLVGAHLDVVTAPGSRVGDAGGLRPDGPTVGDLCLLHADGTVLHASVRTVALPGDGGHSALMIVDRSDVMARRRRLDMLKVISQVSSRSIDGFDEAGAHIDEVVHAFGILLGWAAHIDFDGVAPGGDADLLGDGLDGGERLWDESEIGSIRCISHPVQLGASRLGELTVAAPEHRFVETDPDFVAAAARSIATMTFVDGLHRELHAATSLDVGFDATPVGMQVVAPDGTYLRVNAAFAEMLGRRAADLVGHNWREFIHEDDLSDESLAARRRSLGDRGYANQRYIHADGHVVTARISIVVVDPGTGSSDEWVNLVQVIDITGEMETQARLEASERRYRSLVQPSVDLIMRMTTDLGVVDANDAAVAAAGTTRQEMSGFDLGNVLPPQLVTDLSELVVGVAIDQEPAQVWRQWLEPTNGTPGWYVLRILPEEPGPSGAVDHVYVVASDITELVESEQRLATLALLDPLTQVINRAAIFDRLQHAIDRLARSSGVGVAVAVVDLDHFKSLNDAFGHGAGDNVLRVAADTLTSVVRLQDSVGRLGGDEFVVIFEDVADQAMARGLASRLFDAMSVASAQVTSEVSVEMSASMGVAWTDAPVASEDLISRADHAMYQAKRLGGGRIRFERSADDLHGRPPSTGEVLGRLGSALALDQFRLHYQPIVDTVSGSVIAVEALLRWDHPDQGLLTPDYFLGALLETGGIGPVGRWVVRSVVEQMDRWSQAGTPDLPRFHLNMTPAELADPRLPALLHELTGRYGIDPAAICVELTEQSLTGSVVPTSSLRSLSSLGVSVMLDDFGTGVSSLTQLRQRQLTGVKIDRSFIRGAVEDRRDRAIVEGIVDLAARMDVEVIAEGVEREEQVAWLRDCGCEFVQGWLYAKPMEADDLVEWLQGPPAFA